MNERELKEFIGKHSVETHIIECLKQYLEAYKREHFDEFNSFFPAYSFSKIEMWIHSISFKVSNWPELDYVNIVIELIVSYDGSDVGVYQLFYNLEGEVVDDSLRIF